MNTINKNDMEAAHQALLRAGWQLIGTSLDADNADRERYYSRLDQSGEVLGEQTFTLTAEVIGTNAFRRASQLMD